MCAVNGTRDSACNGTRNSASNGTRNSAGISVLFHRLAHKQKAGQLARSGLRATLVCGYGLGVDDDQLADNPPFGKPLKRRVIVAGLPLRRQAFNPKIISGLASVRV